MVNQIHKSYVQINKKNKELKQLDEFRSNMIDTVSHEFRTPLTSIQGYTSRLLRQDIEIDEETGERICHVFYCDPGKSGQKGKIEKNHVELRKVFPKSVFFSIYSQDDINLALSHINSEPRALLNRNCPGVVAKAFLDIKVISLNNYHFIKPDEVTLHPDLLKKK